MELRIATTRPLPEPDPDEDLLLDALRGAGVDARMVAWRDLAAWEGSSPTVIRSTWDYIHDVDAFLQWAGHVAQRAHLWNPLPVVAANAHKRYLLDLAARGLPVAPTELVPRSQPCDLGRLRAERGWGAVVIKPAVGASSFATERFDADQTVAGQAHLDRLVGAGDVLIQPYLDSVDGYGERALVWIDGRLTHAVRKTPRFTGGDEHVSDAVDVADDERDLARRVMATLPAGLLYARIDVARDSAGEPLVMELELIEPSLFLLQCPEACDRLTQSLVARLRVA